MIRLMSRAHDDVTFIAEGATGIKMVSSCPLAVVQPGGLVTKEQREDSMSQHNVRELTSCPHWQWPHQAPVSCSS